MLAIDMSYDNNYVLGVAIIIIYLVGEEEIVVLALGWDVFLAVK